MSIRVKICGITNHEDAHQATACGADALGFVLYHKSKRYIDPAHAADIVAALPPFVTPVGLFVNAASELVSHALTLMPTLLPQFHGDESEATCAQFGRPYMKAVRVQSQADIVTAEATYPSANALLLDAYVTNTYGGTGQVFDWEIIPQTRMPLIIAGGLHPENVSQLLDRVRPFALDVSSGVESAPGKKDPQLVQSFIAEVAKYE